ncbi:MAG: NADH:ubiquinone oxidoreductase subunit NDUFA12 [Alphaproteobacteria bacterium]|nr:NADH:ubiquinone oxidoreductase subunit NDUFA12 [Alphaproteobacteria bacterium]MBV9370385.1 NADH:ubiquinone oxidoreductase subunit NDUFA12 [Alphaproteobacteria bacterium]MBV9901958.1 NADH:ubiquinone oxidoreductase subunit NDUFA12 [Alphaproteobacteria bacterium]
MGFFKQIFTWWEGATLTTGWHVRRNGRQVGSDDQGNLYFAARKGGRRWVLYNGPNDASRIPPEWYSWLHHQIEGLPDESLPPPPKFLKEAVPNLTGTPQAYRPSGSLERGGHRAAASGDYEAWTPDGA